jgi:hypothetical protein
MKTRVAVASLASSVAVLATGFVAPAAQASDYCVYDVETDQDIVCVPMGEPFVVRYLTDYFQVYVAV